MGGSAMEKFGAVFIDNSFETLHRIAKFELEDKAQNHKLLCRNKYICFNNGQLGNYSLDSCKVVQQCIQVPTGMVDFDTMRLPCV